MSLFRFFRCSGQKQPLNRHGNPWQRRRLFMEGLEERRVLSTVTFDGDVEVIEGDTGTQAMVFTVRRDVNDGEEAVDFSIVGDTATLGEDFEEQTGTLDFNGGNDLFSTIIVQITGDTGVEQEETLFVQLSNGQGGVVIGDAQAVGTILNDDVPNLSVSDSQGANESGNAVFSVSLDQSPVDVAQVTVQTSSGSAIADADYAPVTQTLIFNPGGLLTQNVIVAISEDGIVESSENFTLDVQVATNVNIVDGQGEALIPANDVTAISIGDVALNEGGANNTDLNFSISLSRPASKDITVMATTNDATAGGGGLDYQSVVEQPVTIPAGLSLVTFSIPIIGDTIVEADETFELNLSSPLFGGIVDTNRVLLGDAQGIGTIQNDDSALLTGRGTSSVEAGGANQFLFELSNPVDVDVSVQFGTVDETAIAGSDYAPIVDFPLLFTAGQTVQLVEVVTFDDDLLERDELVGGDLSNLFAHGREVALGSVESGTILNDDAATVTISSVNGLEGDFSEAAFDFLVTLNGSVDTPFSVDVATSEVNEAIAETDFVANTATFQFQGNDGESQTFPVQVIDDALVESDESFAVSFSNLQSTGRAIALVDGTGTIMNDDLAEISIDDVTVTEGNESFTTDVVFTVSMQTPASRDVTVVANTISETALGGGNDYVDISNQLVTIPAGQTSALLVVSVSGDRVVEDNEVFGMSLSDPRFAGVADAARVVIVDAQGIAVIENDDQAMISIGDHAANEGTDLEPTSFLFTVSSDKVASQDMTVLVSTNAIAMQAIGGGVDFSDVVNQAVTIPAGSLTATVGVEINAENLVELDETFAVDISDIQFNASTDTTRAVIVDAQAIGTIVNDDVAELVIADLSQEEGDSGQTTFDFVASLTNPVDTDVVALVNTLSGTATSGVDYLELTDLVISFNEQSTETSLTVQIIGETKFEAHETFNLLLSDLNANGRNVSLAAVNAIGTILNDDTRVAGVAYLDANNNQMFDIGEPPLAGALITVIRTDVADVTPTREMLTGLDGSYVFMDQPAGTYQVLQRQPLAVVDGVETIGVGATGPGTLLGNDVFHDIVLAKGEDGQGYNFGETRLVQPVSMRWYVASSASLALLLRERIANVEELAGNETLAARIRSGESIETVVLSVDESSEVPSGEGEEISAVANSVGHDSSLIAEGEFSELGVQGPLAVLTVPLPNDEPEQNRLPTEVSEVASWAAVPLQSIYGPLPAVAETMSEMEVNDLSYHAGSWEDLCLLDELEAPQPTAVDEILTGPSVSEFPLSSVGNLTLQEADATLLAEATAFHYRPDSSRSKHIVDSLLEDEDELL